MHAEMFIEYLPAHDAQYLKKVLFGGEPWVVICENTIEVRMMIVIM